MSKGSKQTCLSMGDPSWALMKSCRTKAAHSIWWAMWSWIGFSITGQFCLRAGWFSSYFCLSRSREGPWGARCLTFVICDNRNNLGVWIQTDLNSRISHPSYYIWSWIDHSNLSEPQFTHVYSGRRGLCIREQQQRLLCMTGRSILRVILQTFIEHLLYARYNGRH